MVAVLVVAYCRSGGLSPRPSIASPSYMQWFERVGRGAAHIDVTAAHGFSKDVQRPSATNSAVLQKTMRDLQFVKPSLKSGIMINTGS
jgi:hypothetical protein